jgi:hypothetical protein
MNRKPNRETSWYPKTEEQKQREKWKKQEKRKWAWTEKRTRAKGPLGKRKGREGSTGLCAGQPGVHENQMSNTALGHHQALCTQFLPNLVPYLSILIAREGTAMGRASSLRHCYKHPQALKYQAVPCCPACLGWLHFSTAKELPLRYWQQLPSEEQIFLQGKTFL